MSLTPKREAFAQAVASGMTQADAYRSAFDTSRMKAETVQQKASRLMADGTVRARVKELQEAAASAAVMTRREALERLSAFARANLADLIEFGEYEVGSDEDGKPIIQAAWKIRDAALIDPIKMAAISELTAGRDGIKIKTHSPLHAIQQLAKMQGWESATKHELSGPNGGPVETVDLSKLSDTALAELMAARPAKG